MAVAADKQFDGAGEYPQRDEALDAAIRSAVAKFYADFTPSTSTRELAFDKSDLAQRPIIDFATGGNIGRATEEMRAYRQKDPKSPVAAYNLAVLLEASGNLAEALDLYTQAAASSGKAEYGAAKSNCARALADQKALQQ